MPPTPTSGDVFRRDRWGRVVMQRLIHSSGDLPPDRRGPTRSEGRRPTSSRLHGERRSRSPSATRSGGATKGVASTAARANAWSSTTSSPSAKAAQVPPATLSCAASRATDGRARRSSCRTRRGRAWCDGYVSASVLPRPMLLRSGQIPTGQGWVFELKYDGFRAMVSIEKGLQVRSRLRASSPPQHLDRGVVDDLRPTPGQRPRP
jgi:ATP-dependent DNA ligase